MKGRPSRKEEAAINRVTMRLTDDELDLLEKKRALYNMSKSDFIREAMIYYAEIIDKKVVNA